MRTRLFVLAGLTSALTAVSGALAGAAGAQQLPLAPARDSGQTVTPVFEGWYKNPDGTFSLSFGYYNRNSVEKLDIPIGPANFIAPRDSNQGQPTHFDDGRHWGVFAVKVPADFGDKAVVWTLNFRGLNVAIPGSLKRGWEIDALSGETASGNTPPTLKFEQQGPGGQGPGGIYAKPMTAVVGKPITIDVWATDEPGRPATRAAAPGRATAAGTAGASTGGAATAGAATAGAATGGAATAGRAAGAGRGTAAAGPTLAWLKHQGPGEVTFTPPVPRPDRAAEGKATTTVTFSEPGEYVLRLRANDSAVASAGHAQCCWTNGFVKVTVSR
jgi:hypothetical protein